MSVCVFSIEIQTAGQIAMKFGTEVVLEGGKVVFFWGGGRPGTPTPVRLGKNFKKQKYLGTPDLVW